MSEREAEIRWRCRRGMLELDLLLNGFLDREFETLDKEQLSTFDRLLSYPDQVLHDILFGKMKSVDESICKIASMIVSASTKVDAHQ